MHERGLSHSTPRWVTMAGIAVIALLLLLGGLHLVVGPSPGGHHDYVPPSTEHERHRS